ncbi:hypothetical protein [Streptomyces sp. NPDC056165]|uniref:hypothetical protein n=1 Tax=Streptomyces sp. NPDC056165 TaxID=3345733 RepID=UPI0035E2D3A6
MKNLPAPSSPTVAIARVLRDLGLTQGRGCDFRVTGEYRNGERIGTYVLPLTRHADEVIAEHADEIERLTAETGWAFRVLVRYPSGDRPMTVVAGRARPGRHRGARRGPGDRPGARGGPGCAPAGARARAASGRHCGGTLPRGSPRAGTAAPAGERAGLVRPTG